MAISVRPLGDDDDLRDALTPVTHSFGDPVDDDWLEDAADFLERDRFFSAREGDRPVGSAAALSWRVGVPGGDVTTAAVTEVGVFSTHRRRGVASMAMRALLDDAAERGETVATLYASEATIYRRFGFGPAAATVAAKLDTRHADLVRRVDTGGTFRVETPSEIRETLVSVFDRSWHRFPGEHSRPPGYWTVLLRDRSSNRQGWSALQAIVHHDTDGAADGYVLFRTKGDWTDALPNGTTRVAEVIAVSDEVELALLQHLFARDLFPNVDLQRRPVDDPLRWQLRDSRRLVRSSDPDSIWVRFLDVAAALSARRYDASGDVVVEITDDFRPGAGGRFEIVVGNGGVGQCRRTDRPADITLPTYDLASAYLGFNRLRSIATAGRVVEHRDGAIPELDRMLHWPIGPRNYTNF